MTRQRSIIAGIFVVGAMLAAISVASANDIQQFTTVPATDVARAAFGGMRDDGTGSLTVSGVSGTVTKAYLYWQGPTNSSDPAANAAVSFAGTPVTGTNIGLSSDNCWGFANSQGYRADVTSLVTGNGSYALAGMVKDSGSINVNGASLIVFFDDGNASNNRDVVLFDGNDSNTPNTFDADGWNVVLSGINYTSGSAAITMHVADGQAFDDDALVLNSSTLEPAGPIFQGDTVPGGTFDADGNLWDIKTFDITSFLSPGPNTLTLTTGLNSDCLSLVVAEIDLPAGAAPPPPTSADLSVTKADAPDPVTVGQELTYTVTVANAGPDAAQNVSLTDTLPATVAFVSATPSQGSCSGTATVSCDLGTIIASASATVTIRVTPTSDADLSNTASASSITPDPNTANNSDTEATVVEPATNTPPSVNAGGPYSGTEGSPVSLDGTVTDPDPGDTVTTIWSYAPGAGVDAGATCSFGDPSAVDTSITCTDDGTFILTLTANDGVNPDASATADLVLANANPSVAITAPGDASTYAVGATVNLSASVTDAGANDTHTCSIDWGDGTVEAGTLTSGTCTGSHAYAAVGVYTVTVSATDDDGGTGSAEIMLVITDQSMKVTGGGFIVDGGRTSFGFVVQDDHEGLRGQIQVRAPEHNLFHGDTVTALAISNTTATWWGTGRWNGADGYTFEVTVVDNGRGHKKGSTPDQFSITIRDSSNAVVFSASGPLKGGNVTLH